ncbi:hypothetical protein Micbo1qcDRAFT_168784 [Microdochium bolleyi]|uniref:FAD/NAD(P)-binding domain-containing protein n=1 Tax=Microdochium bolleyi TaxID=196109 RepID=A0A136INF1_9PEZI|nr:hypothetical protein Micbo1qcDRAFT_168784 [Microdochium bolleyi]
MESDRARSANIKYIKMRLFSAGFAITLMLMITSTLALTQNNFSPSSCSNTQTPSFSRLMSIASHLAQPDHKTAYKTKHLNSSTSGTNITTNDNNIPISTMAAAVKADVLIFGAGPAGLATAGALARQLFTTIVFSDHTSPNGGGFRNARTRHMHNVPGWDHQDPAVFRAKSRADILARYSTIEFRDVGVRSVRQIAGGDGVDGGVGGVGGDKMRFEAVDVDGVVYRSRRLVVASGIRDVMPEEEIPGYTKLWGRTIYHCLFCHGYEERGHASAAVLATDMLANPAHGAGVARMASRLAGSVNVYTNGNEALGDELRAALRDKSRFNVINDKIARVDKDLDVEGNAGLLVTMADGRVNKEGFMAHMPPAELNGPFAADLGLKLHPAGYIDVASPVPLTSVPGVYAAGDCATMMRAVPTAIFMGACAAAGIAHELTAEDDVEQ